jgi:pimeloyl-ACP methyl ester carboxylesterase
VFWVDNDHVIVGHTYLPLAGIPARERSRRTENPAIAEVDVRTGEAQAIVWEPFATFLEQKAGARSDAIVGVDWDAHEKLLTMVRELKDRSRKPEYYVKLGHTWRKRESPFGRSSFMLPFIERKESPTTRPKLYVTGGGCRCTRMLVDPSPEADTFRFGREEILTWRDPKGYEWKGGLIYPIDYQPGKRYPFILQTHGYSDTEFVIDGPSGTTTAFAAQPLANAGFLVLQAGESRTAITNDDQEGKNVADGWKAVIDELDARGLIDPRRVGIIGWSRTGYHVAAMMATYPDVVAAATISDSVQYDYTQSLLAVGAPSATSADQSVTGGPPSKVGYGTWFEQNIFYGLSHSSAALRVEAIGALSLMAMWETYAVYVQAGKPADFVYFPEGSHVLLKPSERLGSQGGNVDWFQFWLQGHENSDPDEKEQYSRWEKLCDLRVTSRPRMPTFCVSSTKH